MSAQRILTSRGRAFLWLGALVSAGGVALGYPDATRIGLLLAALPLVTLLLVRRDPPQLQVQRTLSPSRLAPDQRGEVQTRFVNSGDRRTPMYLAEERFDFQLGDRPRFVLPRMSPGEERRLSYGIRSRHRGAYQLGPLVVRQRDPFGLTFTAVRLSSTAEVLVLPRVVDLGAGGLRGQGRGSEGEQPQMVALHGEDDVSIRSYRDGDELRRVHWPATAHRGELMVRQEDRPTRRRAILMIDCRATAHPGSGVSASFEWAVSAIASVARFLVADGFVVHLLTPASVQNGSAAHPIELAPALDELARLQRVSQAHLEQVAGAAHAFTSGGVLAVAALVAHDQTDLHHVAEVREPGSRALAFVLDRESFEQGGEVRQPPVEASTLTDAGWQTAVVGPGTEIATAWVRLRTPTAPGVH